MKILVTIANYGTKNDSYLRRLIEEYRALPYEVDIVVLVSVAKEVEGATQVVLHSPVGDPWTFPFAHKSIFASRIDQYDLFIYSEDDTLITQRSIEAFLRTTEVLEDDEIAGFLRVENTPEGRASISTINGHFRWDVTSVVHRGQFTFAFFTNEHAASYLLTRQQLRRAIGSGGFLVQPHESKYDLLVTAATDPYTQCGFRKLVCISHLDDFLLAHLPNKYIGQFGVDKDEVETQIAALRQIGEGSRQPSLLFRTESQIRHQRWSKGVYEAPRQDVIDAIPKHVRSILSFGCGNGALEAELKVRGFEVTAAPLDSVFGACVEARGVHVVYGDADSIWSSLQGRRFDCVVVLDLLHLIPEPSDLLKRLAGLVADPGCIVASVPNMAQVRMLWKKWKGNGDLIPAAGYETTGLHATSYWRIRSWFQTAGLAVKSVNSTPPKSDLWLYRTASRLFPLGFAGDFVIQSALARN